MNYKPNFNDPRVRARCFLALTFVKKFTHTYKPQWLYSKWIYHKDNFGSDRNQLSVYLKELLLICVNEKYSVGTEQFKGKCKEYIASEIGINYLRSQLGLDVSLNKLTNTHKLNSYCSVDLFDQHQDELTSGCFETQNKSNREYHSLQFLPSDLKDREFARWGYSYNVDIIAAAPRLLLQYAQQLGHTKPTPNIEHYLNNRTQERLRLHQLLNLEDTPLNHKLIKKTINGLFNGQYITTRWGSSMMRAFNNQESLIRLLQTDQYLTDLREEIRDIWRTIKKALGLRGRLNAKKKSEIYRKLEEQVKNSVKRYMKKQGIRVFTEHDGWRTDMLYDMGELKRHIKRETGFVIEVD